LGVYNLILAIGAIIIGVMMTKSNYGIFVEFPIEWISKTPFENWVNIGITIIVLFGIGNIFASIISFRKNYIYSIVLGSLLLICIVLQVAILGEWYLATLELLILSIIQILTGFYLLNSKRMKSTC